MDQSDIYGKFTVVYCWSLRGSAACGRWLLENISRMRKIHCSGRLGACTGNKRDQTNQTQVMTVMNVLHEDKHFIITQNQAGKPSPTYCSFLLFHLCVYNVCTPTFMVATPFRESFHLYLTDILRSCCLSERLPQHINGLGRWPLLGIARFS